VSTVFQCTKHSEQFDQKITLTNAYIGVGCCCALNVTKVSDEYTTLENLQWRSPEAVHTMRHAVVQDRRKHPVQAITTEQ
jgi:hypothetical protein